MKYYKYLLFDLDGTLTDSKLGITNSVVYALTKMGFDKIEYEELIKFIGPPMKETFREYYKFTEDETEKAIGYYREYFKDKGIFENQVYEGIEELLKELVCNGNILAVATSKPTPFAERILDYFDLSQYFSCIIGSNLDGTRVKKGDVIEAVIERLQDVESIERSKILMIGDREHDIVGAKQTGIDSLGVEYGYGSYEELHHNGANYIVKDVYELKALLLKS